MKHTCATFFMFASYHLMRRHSRPRYSDSILLYPSQCKIIK